MPLVDSTIVFVKELLVNDKLWFLGKLWNMLNGNLSPRVDNFKLLDDCTLKITYLGEGTSFPIHIVLTSSFTAEIRNGRKVVKEY
jgi:hypothetical protein